MSRTVPEWIGSNDDTAIPARVKLRIHTKAEGKCATCGNAPLFVQFDHTIPLILGGENRESNLRILCVPCHKAKTKLDVKLKAKVARVRKRHLGIRKTSTLQSRGFEPRPKQHTATRPLVRRISQTQQLETEVE
jgi:5-methylcytosine-specific restriction enzyme A